MEKMKTLTINGTKYEIVDEVARANKLPDITTDDNGKLLQVVDGAWTAVSITNGNEVAY